MYSARIKALHDEYTELIEFCQTNNQVSFAMYINDIYRKTLILSSTSFFEFIITKAIHDFASKVSQQNTEIVAFIDNKAIKRQYHTFFDWDGRNANKFWGLFGDDFKVKARSRIKEQNLNEAEIAFISLGQTRNQLVHQNFVEVQINDTFEEIYNKYIKACDFVEMVVQLLDI